MLLFPIRTYPWRAFATLIAVTLVLPLIVIAAALISADLLPSWLVILLLAVAIGFLLAVNAALTVLAVFIATRNEVTVRDATLHLKGGEFHERVPLSSITGVDIVALGERHELKRAQRRNGIALPGFRIGWFTTNNDDLLFIVRGAADEVLLLRTSLGYSVVLGVDEPTRVAQALRAETTAERH